LGVAWDRTLFYAKGGGAWVHDRFWESQPSLGSFFGPPGTIYAATTSETRWGWMVGGGIEYAFALNWSAKIEYDYLDLGTHWPVFIPTGAATNFTTLRPFDEDIRQTMQLVKVGVNYKFDWFRF
jgi:outer membrane immunogenic protein